MMKNDISGNSCFQLAHFFDNPFDIAGVIIRHSKAVVGIITVNL